MGKKARKSLSNDENRSSQAIETTILLDSTDDTDIIECSIVGENKYDITKNKKRSFISPGAIHTPETPLSTLLTKESRNSILNTNNGLSSSLRKNFRLAEEEKAKSLLETPEPSTDFRVQNSAIKKLISTLKKTPDGPYLSKSKLRNIEQWLKKNAVETVTTPPFANLSITPVNLLQKRFSSQWNEKSIISDESSIDSEVEGVLKAVYGEDWRVKNVKRRARTEPQKKKSKFLSPGTSAKKKKVGVRRNILGGRKLNLNDCSDEENNLDDSVLSGVKFINLNSPSCSDERTKTNVIKTLRKNRKCESRRSSLESLYLTPLERKKPKTLPSGEEENKRLTSKPSTAKKSVPEVPLKTPKKTFLASLSVSTPTSTCHPEAQYYKVNFKSKKEKLVSTLYKLYNKEVFDGKLDENMNFSWNVKLRGTAGYCYNKRLTKSSGEVIRLSRIEFSTKIVDRADRLRDTMIHELCHAASWVIDGILDGHGEVWTRWASTAMKRFPELPLIKRCHNYDIVSKYVYRCTNCGYSIKRHSKSINTERKRCGHCYGVLELLINKKKKGKGEVPEFDTTRTLPTPNKFAMFVKENYHTVKSTKSNAKHSEIMKVLSQQYALFKNGSKSAIKSQEECANQ